MTTVPPSEGPVPESAPARPAPDAVGASGSRPPARPAAPREGTTRGGTSGDVPTPAGSGPGLGRSAAVMAAGTAVSRVLGIVRGAMLVAAIGSTGLAANSFDLANKLPNIAVMLLATGVLNAVLVPQVVRAYRTSAGEDYVNRVITLGAALLLGVTVLLTLGGGVLVRLYSDTASGPQLRALATAFALWCLPQVFFYGMYTLLGQVLNARGSFGPFMWAPVVNNVVAIAGLGVFLGLFGPFHADLAPADPQWWTPGRIALLGGTATLGVVCQAAVLVWPLRRIGFRYRPRWGLRGSGLGGAGRVAGWTFAALAVGQVGFLVATQVMTAADRTAQTLADGGVVVAGNAVYTAAFTLYMLPHSLVTVSLLTALFTRLSTHAAHEDTAGVRADFSRGARTIGVFTLFATSALAVLALPVLRLVLPSQSPAEAAATTPVVVALTAGVAALGTWSLCQRVFYAYEDARSLFWVQVVMAAVVAGGALASRAVLDPWWWVTGIAAAMSLSHVVGTVLAIAGLRRRLEHLGTARVLRLYVRAGIAAAVSAGVGWAIVRAVGALPDDAADVAVGAGMLRAALVCAGVGLVMLAVYVALLRLMRVRELDELAAPLARRLTRRRA
ncbi:murein biosynthesis integral membrane protein MurJ [Cellulomonas sp. ATA003]|uniref:murein biosynthesis integral membrane protein MurJ n=1 Tax=Cellulomonas sp. ATA003 TaxID=3073064 RepID=UPI0028738A3D|nr:murein biosynthesis integral membrane protein MurJ [Cellulomonas sp. ATA003]WNB85599.1 murein biosynthesis integral membrane protein MurJ [Cellulomonas sp. ATA003]